MGDAVLASQGLHAGLQHPGSQSRIASGAAPIDFRRVRQHPLTPLSVAPLRGAGDLWLCPSVEGQFFPAWDRPLICTDPQSVFSSVTRHIVTPSCYGCYSERRDEALPRWRLNAISDHHWRLVVASM